MGYNIYIGEAFLRSDEDSEFVTVGVITVTDPSSQPFTYRSGIADHENFTVIGCNAFLEQASMAGIYQWVNDVIKCVHITKINRDVLEKLDNAVRTLGSQGAIPTCDSERGIDWAMNTFMWMKWWAYYALDNCRLPILVIS